MTRCSRGRLFAREIGRFAGLTVRWQLLHQSACEIEIESMAAASRIYLCCCMCLGCCVSLALPMLCKRDLNNDGTNTLKPGICSITPTISSQAVECRMFREEHASDRALLTMQCTKHCGNW